MSPSWLGRSLLIEQPAVDDADLGVACEIWQGGRDSGWSRLPGAARALTGVRHYLHAPFIRAHQQATSGQREALDAAIAAAGG